jgi:hypothetical protein
MSSLIFMLFLFQVSLADEDVDIVMKKPSMCVEGEMDYQGGQQIYICQDGELIPYKNCPYGAVGDGEGGWKCADNPAPCVIEGRTVFENEHCCTGLIERDDGVCVKEQGGTSPFLIIVFGVLGVLGIWKFIELTKKKND